jgi:hypothetical protein
MAPSPPALSPQIQLSSLAARAWLEACSLLTQEAKTCWPPRDARPQHQPTFAAPSASRNCTKAWPKAPVPISSAAWEGMWGRGTMTRSTVPNLEHSSWMSASTCGRAAGGVDWVTRL